ncbi:MAG: hypothetical protein ACI8RD_006380 [Bacillariaceae sp.]|jgi:hypothetical protein
MYVVNNSTIILLARLLKVVLFDQSDLFRQFYVSSFLFSRPAVDPKGMIGIKYGNNNMMEPKYPMAFHEEDDAKYIEKEKDRSTNLAIDSDSSNIDSCSVITPKVCSGTSSSTNKKASILKSPLLRLTRTKKRSSGAVVREKTPPTNNAIINSSSSGTNGSSTNNDNSSASNDDKTKIHDTIIEDNTSGCEKEDHIHCHDNDNDTYNNVSANPIDYDDDDINVNVNVNVNDRGRLNISDIESDEDEFKKGIETNRKSSRPLHASTNLSIVVTRNEVVVEYRDKDQEGDRQKQSSPDLQPSVGSDEKTTPTNATSKSNSINTSAPTSTSKRFRYIVRKGIMKRPRDSNITYHHPQKPNHPPPGYDVKSLWRKDYTANSTTDREYPHQRLRSQPTKRVSFDEVSLTEQFQLSQLRRQTRHKRRGVFDMLAMVMPVILPYLIAISILLASSLVPLPQSPSSSSQPKVVMSSEQEVEILPKPPIIFDLASRMWDERKLRAATKISDRDETNKSSNEDYITGRTGKDKINRQPFDARKKSITDTQQQISAGSMRNKSKNPTDKTVATVSVVVDKRKSKTNTYLDSTASQDEGREVATKNKNSTVQRRNPVVRVLSAFMKILAQILFPFHKSQKTT